MKGQAAGRTIKVLLIEDNRSAAEVLKQTLDQVSYPKIVTEWADRVSKGLKRLAQGGVDVILIDLTLPDSKSLEAFVQTHDHSPTVPVVIIMGSENRDLALKALQYGAQDYT